MNHLLHGVVRAVCETFELPGPILEIGAYQTPGQENIANLRPLFPDEQFIGFDMRPGPGVDQVGNVESLPFADASVGAVLALSAFEHVRRFWRGFDEVRRVLRPDGAFLVACPFFFRIHNFPDDYWRFTPSALDGLLEDYSSRILGWHGPRHRPANVWALAFREDHAPVTEAQFAQYKSLLPKYAKEPSSMNRRLRYAVAQFWCGRGPFAPYLDRNQVETVCHNVVA